MQKKQNASFRILHLTPKKTQQAKLVGFLIIV